MLQAIIQSLSNVLEYDVQELHTQVKEDNTISVYTEVKVDDYSFFITVRANDKDVEYIASYQKTFGDKHRFYTLIVPIHTIHTNDIGKGIMNYFEKVFTKDLTKPYGTTNLHYARIIRVFNHKKDCATTLSIQQQSTTCRRKTYIISQRVAGVKDENVEFTVSLENKKEIIKGIQTTLPFHILGDSTRYANHINKAVQIVAKFNQVV